MKLFGGSKRRTGSAPESGGAVSDETKVIPLKYNKIKAAVVRSKEDQKRAAKISIWTAAIVLLLILGVSVLSRVWDGKPAPEAEPSPDIVAEEMKTADDDSSGPDVILPVIPHEPEEIPGQQEYAQQSPGENAPNPSCRTFLFAVYDNKSVNLDTIIAGRLNREEGTMDIVNIHRDTLVNVDWDVKKIGTVMANEEGDAQRFLNELSCITGISVDYYAFVEAEAVEKIVDEIGGIYYTVPINMSYGDGNQTSFRINSGIQWLNGANAVQMLKFSMGNNGTGYPNGELGRLETVQDFIMTILAMFISGSDGVSPDGIIEILLRDSESNLTEECLRNFAEQLQNMDGSNIRFGIMPGENVRIRSMVYYEIAPVEWAEMINEYLNPYSQEIVLHNLDILMFDESSRSVMSTCGEMVDYNSFS